MGHVDGTRLPQAGCEVRVVFCTVPDAELGARIGRELVESRLAACVSLVPGLRSIYTWHGQVCDDLETLLMIKTTQDRLADLMPRLKTMHPCEVPELLSLAPDAGWPAYLDWVVESTRPISPEPT